MHFVQNFYLIKMHPGTWGTPGINHSFQNQNFLSSEIIECLEHSLKPEVVRYLFINTRTCSFPQQRLQICKWRMNVVVVTRLLLFYWSIG